MNKGKLSGAKANFSLSGHREKGMRCLNRVALLANTGEVLFDHLEDKFSVDFRESKIVHLICIEKYFLQLFAFPLINW